MQTSLHNKPELIPQPFISYELVSEIVKAAERCIENPKKENLTRLNRLQRKARGKQCHVTFINFNDALIDYLKAPEGAGKDIDYVRGVIRALKRQYGV